MVKRIKNKLGANSVNLRRLESIRKGKVSLYTKLSKVPIKIHEVIYRGKTIHDEIYKRLKERNLPEPEVIDKIYIREVATGFKLFGIDRRMVDDRVESLLIVVRDLTDEHGLKIYNFEILKIKL